MKWFPAAFLAAETHAEFELTTYVLWVRALNHCTTTPPLSDVVLCKDPSSIDVLVASLDLLSQLRNVYQKTEIVLWDVAWNLLYYRFTLCTSWVWSCNATSGEALVRQFKGLGWMSLPLSHHCAGHPLGKLQYPKAPLIRVMIAHHVWLIFSFLIFPQMLKSGERYSLILKVSCQFHGIFRVFFSVNFPHGVFPSY